MLVLIDEHWARTVDHRRGIPAHCGAHVDIIKIEDVAAESPGQSHQESGLANRARALEQDDGALRAAVDRDRKNPAFDQVTASFH